MRRASDAYLSRLVLSVTVLLFSAACDVSPNSGYGFTLPEGNESAGEIAFRSFHSTDCHAMHNRDDLREGVEPIMTVAIGGKTTRISTYGELVTSVINPSHKNFQKTF